MKVNDTELPAITADTTGAVRLLNGMSKGYDDGERIGRQIHMKAVELNLWNYVTPSTGTDQSHRVLLVYDRQTNGSAPAVTDVLSTAHPLALLNHDNIWRFEIILDRSFSLMRDGVPGDNVFWGFQQELSHTVEFTDGDAGTVADIASGSLYLISVGSNAAGATAGSVKFGARVHYDDI